jgi:hypothetical protein
MKRELIALAVAGVSLVGCDSSGLSPREVPGRTQAALLYDLYDQELASASAAPAKPLRLPANVAVVQVGEVAPPDSMLNVLRKDPAVFARVETLPGAEPFVPQPDFSGWSGNRWGQAAPPAQTAPRRPTLAAMRRLAADVGLDYVLLVGGTIDHGSSGTPLSLFDITIVGGFLVPSRETRATARASAALIDVPTGRVILNSSAEAHDHSLVPAASVEGERVKLLESVRDAVVANLGAQVLADTRTRAASWPAAASANATFSAPGAVPMLLPPAPAPASVPALPPPAPLAESAAPAPAQSYGWQTLPAGTRYDSSAAARP